MFNITGEMRIKPAMRCYFIPTRMAIIKKTNNNCVDEDVEQLTLYTLLVGM